jgi:hypothetical protein
MSFLSELKRRRVGKVAIASRRRARRDRGLLDRVPGAQAAGLTMTFVVVFLLVGFPL